MSFDSGLYDKDRMIVPIAIREDLVARLQIPTDLTEAEARKIAAVVMAYAASGIDTRQSQDGETRLGPKDESPTAESGDAQRPPQ